MATQIQLRRGTESQWYDVNPTLMQGEVGIELDTNKFKIGDGTSDWNSLPYSNSGGGSGSSGSSGSSGESGTSGSSGESGSSGSSGESGTTLNFIGVWTPASYNKDTVAISPSDRNTYISTAVTVNVYTDPSSDPTEWALYTYAGSNGTSGTSGGGGDSWTTSSVDIQVNSITVGAGSDATQNNIILGKNSLSSNTTGSSNIAIGTDAMYANSTGYKNIAIGENALTANTDGHSNTAIGTWALQTNQSGFYNVAVGLQALEHMNDSGNTAIGRSAMNIATYGSDNTAIGLSSMEATENCAGNTALGAATLQELQAGSENIAIGRYAMGGAPSGSHNIAIGISALNVVAADNNIAIGQNALLTLNSGTNNIVIGNNSATTATDRSNTVIIGNNIATPDSDNTILIGDGYGNVRISVDGGGGVSLNGGMLDATASYATTAAYAETASYVIGGGSSSPSASYFSSSAIIIDSTPRAIVNSASYDSATTIANIDMRVATMFDIDLSTSASLTITSSNMDSGRTAMIRIKNVATSFATTASISLPSGWTYIGGTKPTVLPGGRSSFLSISCFGPSDSDVVCGYSFNPI